MSNLRKNNLTYRVWQYIKKRHKIGKMVVCPEWLDSFETFLADMGPRPKKTNSLVVKDESQPYCRTNCAWEDSTWQQAMDLPVEIDGVIKRAEEWIPQFDLNEKIVYERFCKGLRSPEIVTNGYHYHRTPCDLDRALAIAKTYETRSSFVADHAAEYQCLFRYGLIEGAFEHMKRMGSLYQRYVYVIALDNVAYIGLTLNPKKRSRQHSEKGRKVVRDLMSAGAELKVVSDLLDKDEAAAREGEVLEEYRAKGYTILNDAKTGGLGGNQRKWTKDTIAAEAKKYTERTKFCDGSSGAYCAALRLRIMDEVCAHMNEGPHKWTKEEIVESAKKYSLIRDFYKNDNRAYCAADRLGILDEVTSHMERINTSWSDEEILAEAKKYDSKNQFRTESVSAYQAACRRKILDESCAHMKTTRNTWTKEKIIAIAAKYTTLKEFREKEPLACEASFYKKCHEEATRHMIKRKPWTNEEIFEEAKRFSRKIDFYNGSNAYRHAYDRGIIDQVCSHMK